MEWLANTGISAGWVVAEGKEFRPYINVARADMAAFLHRLARLAGIQDPHGSTINFEDVTPGTAHYEDIVWLSRTGITLGWQRGEVFEFRPFASVARADMAAFMHRLHLVWENAKSSDPVQQTYTIAYNANGGVGTMANQTVRRGASVALVPNAFTRSNCRFTGWNTKADGTGTFYWDKTSVKDLAAAGQTIWLYAWWVPSTYGVHYYANDGTGHGWNDQLQCGVDEYILDCMFTKSGYDFVCWNTKPDGTGTNYNAGARVRDLAKEDEWFELYAQWGSKSYTVKFNANGGSGTMSAQTVEVNTYAYLTSNAYYRSGYTFVGWNTSSNGTGTSYANGARVYNLRSAGGSISLYAQWKRNAQTYTISYNANGGTGGPGSKQVEVGQSAVLSTWAPTRAGYDFMGWNTRADGWGDEYQAGSSYSSNTGANGSVTLYAYWRRNYGNGWNDAYTWDIYNAYNEWRQAHGLSVVPVDVSNTCHIYAENCARGCANQRRLVHRLGIPADK